MKLLILFLLLTTSACSHKSYQTALYQNMALGLGGGFIMGQFEPRNPNTHSVMYAGMGAALAAAATIYFKNPDTRIEQLQNENELLKKALEGPKTSLSLSANEILAGSGKVPEKYRKMIVPGEVRIYSIDQWVDDLSAGGEGRRVIHQDKVLEFHPPTLKPSE